MQKKNSKANGNGNGGSQQDGFINVPVTRATREGLHDLKESMGAASQAEVIEKAVAIMLAIQKAARN